MAGRPRKLDAEKKAAAIGMIAAGCTRLDVATYLNISPSTLQHEAERDAKFLDGIREAEIECKMGYIKNIKKAAEKDWKAGAWFLERRYWQEYAKREYKDVNVTLPQDIEAVKADLMNKLKELPEDKEKT